jgi:hypothetical protein
MEETVMEILEKIIEANYQINKTDTLAHLRVKLEVLQVEIRVLKSLGSFSYTQYEFSSKAINELKRLLFGWMKSDKNRKEIVLDNAYGNYYFGIDFEKLDEKEPEHTEENLTEELKKINSKTDSKKLKKSEREEDEASKEHSGYWLFSREDTDDAGEK